MGKFSRNSKFSRKDIITDLPQSIIETILTKLPIRDAIRTSILSSKWRNKWTTLPQLIFDDFGMGFPCNVEEVVNFVTRSLLLHDGPIQKFAISSNQLEMSPDIDQWLLFLSRKDIKELELKILWFESLGNKSLAPSRIFSFQKLTSLVLCGIELKPPSGFKGFPCLKNLGLSYLFDIPGVKAIENLISSCPLLETFKFSKFDYTDLTVHAPNLKYLTLEGCFIDVYLYTPHLVAFHAKFILDEVFKGTGEVPMTYDYLKLIKAESINFAEKGEMLYFLHLLLNSPNLIQISAKESGRFPFEETNLDFWEKECPSDFTFKQLKIVNISEVCGRPQEMEFLKFVLRRSPVLEVMNICPSRYVALPLDQRIDILIELLQFRRASAKAEIKFILS